MISSTSEQCRRGISRTTMVPLLLACAAAIAFGLPGFATAATVDTPQTHTSGGVLVMTDSHASYDDSLQVVDNLAAPDRTGIRALVHNEGCTRASCMRFCNACTIPRGGRIGHCRKRGRYFNCSVREVFTSPPGPGVPPLPTFDEEFPLVEPATGALPDTEARLTMPFDVEPVGIPIDADLPGEGVPATGFLQFNREATTPPRPNGDTFCVSANDARIADVRDSVSAYVNARNSCIRRTIFSFEPVDEGFIIQAVDIRTTLGPTANGWYMGVHDFYSTDRGTPDDLRVIFHSDRNRAAVWEFVEHNGGTVVVLTRNFDASGHAQSSVGQYLAIPDTPVRTMFASVYMSVNADIGRAVRLSVVEEAPTA